MSTLQEKSTRTYQTINCVDEDGFLKFNGKPSSSFESANSELIFVQEEQFVSGGEKFDPILVDNAHSTLFGCGEQSFLHSLPNSEENFQETKIDIHDHLLKEENYSQKFRSSRTALLQDLVNSLDVLCDICDDKEIERVIKLNQQESLTAAVILKKGLSLGLKRNRIFSRKIPVQSCGRCFTRIVLFRIRFEEKLLKTKIKKETEMDPPWNHGIDCPCPTCQNQYGSLGLIVRGMETLSSQASFQNMPQAPHYLPQSQNVSDPEENRALHDRQEQGDFQAGETQAFHPTQVSLNPRNLLQSVSECDNIPATVPTTYSYIHDQEQQHFRSFSGSSRQYDHVPMEIHSSTVEKCQLAYSHPVSSPNIQEESEEKPFPLYSTSHSETSVDARTSFGGHDTLPLTLQDFEDRTRPDVDQPSTSSGYPDGIDERSFAKSKRVCVHCQKQFNHTGDFRKHLRKHTKEKPYACKQCDKRFSHTSNLHRHERSHTGTRPYKCEFCNKEFNRKDKLDSHRKSKSCKNRRHEGTN